MVIERGGFCWWFGADEERAIREVGKLFLRSIVDEWTAELDFSLPKVKKKPE